MGLHDYPRQPNLRRVPPSRRAAARLPRLIAAAAALLTVLALGRLLSPHTEPSALPRSAEGPAPSGQPGTGGATTSASSGVGDAAVAARPAGATGTAPRAPGRTTILDGTGLPSVVEQLLDAVTTAAGAPPTEDRPGSPVEAGTAPAGAATGATTTTTAPTIGGSATPSTPTRSTPIRSTPTRSTPTRSTPTPRVTAPATTPAITTPAVTTPSAPTATPTAEDDEPGPTLPELSLPTLLPTLLPTDPVPGR